MRKTFHGQARDLKILHFPLLNLAFQDIVDPFFLPDTDGAPSDTSDTNSVVGVGGRKEDKGKNNRSIFQFLSLF